MKLKSAEQNLKKAKAKYVSQNKKFEKLKRKGKLSIDDHAKWEKKFSKLKGNIAKAEKRLRKL